MRRPASVLAGLLLLSAALVGTPAVVLAGQDQVTTIDATDIPIGPELARVQSSYKVQDAARAVGTLDWQDAQASRFPDQTAVVVPYARDKKVFLFSAMTNDGKEVVYNIEFLGNNRIRFFDSEGGMEARIETRGDQFRLTNMRTINGRLGFLDGVLDRLGPSKAEAASEHWLCFFSCMGAHCGIFTSCWWTWTGYCSLCTYQILTNCGGGGSPCPCCACISCITKIGSVGTSCYSHCWY